MSRVLVTGDAGFIGFHLVRSLIAAGHSVFGLDGMTTYYDPTLKADRLSQLLPLPRYQHLTVQLEDMQEAAPAVVAFDPEIIVHLAAQAGVRYSLENPDAYLSSNVTGTLRVLELARQTSPQHVLIASTSSVYGGNTRMPFSETDAIGAPVSLYASTKIATEAIAHSFSHLWKIPTTCFRFFTVYGPWGRPDMALYKFTDAMLSGREIDVYGHGEMKRDFTYVSDLVESINALVARPPVEGQPLSEVDSLSPIAPFRIVNIAGGSPVGLLQFIDAIEEALGQEAKKRMLPMQPGDVVATWADATLLRDLVGTVPSTPVRDGVREFMEWYLSYRSDRSQRD